MTMALAAASYRSDPTTPVVPTAQLLMAHDPGAPRCEEIRALRTQLLLCGDTPGGADIIALLSPCTGEGRSLLAAELAIAMAQTGQPTLLVDADLRHPHQHVLFGTSNLKGLAHDLEYNSEPHVHPVHGLPQLSLLTAGQASANPVELLSGGRFAAMIQDWRSRFRFVVIDTAPVIQYSDGLAVAVHTRRVLTLCRASHTPFSDMQEMLRRLATTRSRILGAAINHF